MTTPDYPPPTVAYKALNPDNCNIQDHEYERAIDRFMERYMPGFPKSLLERDRDRYLGLAVTWASGWRRLTWRLRTTCPLCRVCWRQGR